jgi:RND family efflux transporter MFP subunit
MKSRHFLLAMNSSLITFISILGCSKPHDASKPADSATKVTTVVTVTPDRQIIRRLTEQPGQIDAIETAPMYARLAGYVEKVNVDIGDRVKKGQILAELFVPEIMAESKQKTALVEQAKAEKKDAEASSKVATAALGSAEARIGELQAGIKRAQADVARWKGEYVRIEQLVRERAQTGTVLDETRNKLTSAEASEEEARAQFKAVEADLNEAKAKLEKAATAILTSDSHIEVAKFDAEKAQAMLDYAQLVAPFDGIVTRRHADTGQLTTPGTTGEPMFVLARFDVVTISVGVPEADASFVTINDPAKVRIPAMNNKTVEGKVSRTGWALDETSRTLRTEIDITNTGQTLRPGQYAYVTIISEEHANALTVPSTAVLKELEKSFVTTIHEGKAKRKDVATGINDGKRIEILSGLDASDKVVEVNSASLVDGQPLASAPPVEPPAKPKS